MSSSSPRAQVAVERLYENASLRDELTDDEADALLKWAEAELTRLDRADLDDDSYAVQVDTLLGLLKQINRYAGRQGQAAAQGVDAAPAKIAELAGALGHETQPEQVAAAGTGDPAGTIGALTALLSAQTPNQGVEAAAASAEAGAALPVALAPSATQESTGEATDASPPDSSTESPSIATPEPSGEATDASPPPDSSTDSPHQPNDLQPSGDDIVDL